MLKKINLLALLLAVAVISCNERQKNITTVENSGSQKAEVEQVIQTTSYTYLKVNKNSEEQWIAIVKQDVNEGDIIYYEEGLKMTDFESPELGKTFETIYFVQEISSSPITQHAMGEMAASQPGKPVLNKEDVSIETPEGAVTIADLYANRNTYADKKVKVKGKVTKVNTAIMERNWVHLQDGTADGDNFDLTLTTAHEPKVGDVMTYSGILRLNKDFGYGYSYELLIEEAIPE